MLARSIPTLAASAAILLTAATPAQAVPFGVGDDGAVIANPTLLDQAHDQLGAQWVRFMVHPGHEQKYEHAIHHADQAGLKILVTLTGAAASQYPGWAEWLAGHWLAVDAWSVGNEPELSGFPVCQYMQTYERTRRAIRRVTPTPVLFGELSPHAWRWVELMRYCRPLKRRPDGVAVHTWSGADPMSPKVGKPWSARPKSYRDPVSREPWTKRSHRTWISMARIPAFRRALRRARLNAPIWITEHGWFRDTPAAQVAAWWPRALQQADRVGARVLIAHGAWSTGRHRNWDSSLAPEAHRTLVARAGGAS